jgi:PAS domain S-box-containing protein
MAGHCAATILFVDDDAASRNTLGCLIRDAGYSLLEAGTGYEALQLCQAHRPDLVILDVNLPDLHGFEVCRRLKEGAGARSLAVVHLSAVYVGSGDRSRGLEGGADAYLVKPVEPRELLATVQALLRVHAAELAAQHASQEWRSTFDAISDAVCLLDPAGHVCRCNKAACTLLGRGFGEVIGRPLEDVLCEALHLPGLPNLLFGDNNSSRQSRELLLGERWFRVTGDPIHSNGPSTGQGSVVILTDVTERKRLEEAVLQGQRLEAVGRLAGGIAHDFNNLLTAILGNASLLMRTLPPSEHEHNLAATIERAAWRAAELTRQLLGFSRQTLLWLRPVEPGEILDGVAVALPRPLLPGLRLTVERPPAPWRINADPAQLVQVLTALCRNSIEAMPEGGQLLLLAANEELSPEAARNNPEARAGSFVRFRVEDSGPGIPPNLLDKIFDPFFTNKPVGRGSGLGLAMVHGIVKQHQGWVECHSEPGRGTRFDLYLPRSQPEGTANAEKPPPPPAGRHLVLLAEDDDTLRVLAATYLRQAGFGVLLAGDGQEAVELFQREQEHIDLVILDQLMPRLTGSNALRQMRRLKPSVRALFVTGSSAEAVPGVGEAVGVVIKPYRERDLVQAVKQALGL